MDALKVCEQAAAERGGGSESCWLHTALASWLAGGAGGALLQPIDVAKAIGSAVWMLVDLPLRARAASLAQAVLTPCGCQ